MIGLKLTASDRPQARRDLLLERIIRVLACPDCKVPLDSTLGEGREFECPACGTSVRRQGAQIVTGGFASEDIESDWLNRIKESAKRRLGPLYPTMIEILSPVCLRDARPRFLSTFDASPSRVCGNCLPNSRSFRRVWGAGRPRDSYASCKSGSP